ncbi:subtilisin-like protease SBT5.3 isoform X1 [Panicum miliaceum]|uniref:Subtilisin-like protease SBT5.3 isoform X1 n=1 Tax=Panicum miliaceum TaxID=4540 RepID=A0A3L6TDW1_PANMI|nr:subtilisin-like protease SBT5.3 isoform X1 [Panicum miliaceum]
MLGRGGGGGSRSQVYVVYMGALLLESHLRLVGTVLESSFVHFRMRFSSSTRGQRPDGVVVRQNRHGFSGFAARLSKDQAAALRRRPGVVSVFADPVYQLHTTRSWDFLQQAAVKIDAAARRRGAPKAAAGDPSSSSSPAHREPGTLDSGKVQGKIVLCSHSQGDTSKQVKADDLKSAGAVG